MKRIKEFESSVNEKKNKFTREDIIKGLEEILKNANGYDIDPYIIEKLLQKAYSK